MPLAVHVTLLSSCCDPLFQFDVSDDQFLVSNNDLIGWTIDREDGVVSLRYTEEQNVYFRDLGTGDAPVVGGEYTFQNPLELPAIFSIAARVNPSEWLVVQLP